MILRRVLETCCHSDSRGKPSANAGVKNSQMSKMIIIATKRNPYDGLVSLFNSISTFVGYLMPKLFS